MFTTITIYVKKRLPIDTLQGAEVRIRKTFNYDQNHMEITQIIQQFYA